MKSRITVVETVFFEDGQGGKPVSGESRWSKLLDSDEQPFVRRMKVSEHWKPLEVGWLSACSMLCITNVRARRAFTPTEEDKESEALKVVQLGVKAAVETFQPYNVGVAGTPFANIGPGESLRMPAINLSELVIRTLHGEATVLVTIFPS